MSTERSPVKMTLPERQRMIRQPSFIFWRNLLIALIVMSPFLCRAWFLAKIPDISEPFDVQEFANAQMPVGPNAFDHYRQAYLLKEAVDAGYRPNDNQPLWDNYDEVVSSGWSVARDPLKKWLEDYRETFQEWHRGTECPGARYFPILEMDFHTWTPVSHSLREMARIAQMDAIRLEAEGDLDQAGKVWIAMLRCSRHSGRSGLVVDRLSGKAIHQWAAHGLCRWTALSAVTKDQLLAMDGQVREADQMTLPLSSLFKAEYLARTNSLKGQDWYLMDDLRTCLTQQTEAIEYGKSLLIWFVGEPLAVKRLSKQILANQLNEVDKPLTERRPFAGSGAVLLFQPDPAVPQRPHQMTPTEIDRAIERSFVSKLWLPNLKAFEALLTRERALQVSLEMAILLQAYRREYGEFPEDPSALVPAFVDAWPIDPCDKLGQPLRYRRDQSASAVVWSVGPDGNDDGGDVEDTKSGGSVDVGLQLDTK